MSTIDWPDARLTPFARARAMAAGIPSAACAEITMNRPFTEAWALLMDLERSVPAADRSVHSMTVRSRRRLDDGAEELHATSRSPFGLRERFTVRVEEGYCLMRGSRGLFVVVMAAEPDPDDPSRTRYLHLEAVPRRFTRLLRGVLAGMVSDDVKGFRRFVER
jgi:hypothetical protein